MTVKASRVRRSGSLRNPPSGRWSAGRAGGDDIRVAQVIEVPELESWFIVDWLDRQAPAVLMEFATQDEAEEALSAAFAEMVIELDEDRPIRPFTLCSVLTMLRDPALRRALAAWDTQIAELDASSNQVMDELFLGKTPPILRSRPAR